MGSNVNEVTAGEISRKALTQASFEWKIPDFSRLSITEVGFSVKSPMFSFSDAEWRLEIYPNGQRDTSGWISLYVCKVHSNIKSHYIAYCASIMKQDDTKYDSVSGVETFEGNDSGWGCTQFLRLSSLLEMRNEIIPEDTMTICCTLRSNVCDSKEVASQTMHSEGVDKLTRDFRNLLASEKDSDFTIKVMNKEFRAHKNILRSRSSVFDSMFDHNMSEKNSGTVDIPDCEPKAFQYFLTYLYTASMDNLSDDIVFDLYYIADKYDVEELKRKCAEFMASNLSIDTFCKVIALALQHEESTLRQTATDFFMINTKEVIVSVQWQSFIKENPTTANELYIKSFDNVIQK